MRRTMKAKFTSEKAVEYSAMGNAKTASSSKLAEGDVTDLLAVSAIRRNIRSGQTCRRWSRPVMMTN